jgi:GNAT superfamily N-acetyltransferase
LFREARGDAQLAVRGLLIAQWPPDVVDTWLRDGRVFTVQDCAADPDEPPAGVAVTVIAGPTSVELCAVFVTPAQRRRGAGRHLVLALADRCRAQGARQLTAHDPNSEVSRLLIACGFQPEPAGEDPSCGPARQLSLDL